MLFKKSHNTEMERRSINVQLKSQGSVAEAMNTYKPESKACTTLSEGARQGAHREKIKPFLQEFILFAQLLCFFCWSTLV